MLKTITLRHSPYNHPSRADKKFHSIRGLSRSFVAVRSDRSPSLQCHAHRSLVPFVGPEQRGPSGAADDPLRPMGMSLLAVSRSGSMRTTDTSARCRTARADSSTRHTSGTPESRLHLRLSRECSRSIPTTTALAARPPRCRSGGRRTSASSSSTCNHRCWPLLEVRKEQHAKELLANRLREGVEALAQHRSDSFRVGMGERSSVALTREANRPHVLQRLPNVTGSSGARGTFPSLPTRYPAGRRRFRNGSDREARRARSRATRGPGSPRAARRGTAT
jgi:hypothetical protein